MFQTPANDCSDKKIYDFVGGQQARGQGVKHLLYCHADFHQFLMKIMFF
jgi:hypothetical protein